MTFSRGLLQLYYGKISFLVFVYVIQPTFQSFLATKSNSLLGSLFHSWWGCWLPPKLLLLLLPNPPCRDAKNEVKSIALPFLPPKLPTSLLTRKVVHRWSSAFSVFSADLFGILSVVYSSLTSTVCCTIKTNLQVEQNHSVLGRGGDGQMVSALAYLPRRSEFQSRLVSFLYTCFK